MTLTSLTLADYSDRELLHVVHDLASATEDGFIDSHAIVERLGIRHPRASTCVGSRLAFLARREAIEKDLDAPKRARARWRVTSLGQVMAFGDATPEQRRAIDEAEPAEVLMLTRLLASSQRGAPIGARTLIQREWRREAHLLNGGNGRG